MKLLITTKGENRRTNIPVESTWYNEKREEICGGGGFHTIKLTAELMREFLDRKFIISFVAIPSKNNNEIELDISEVENIEIR
jgi:hypothetical protein